jgi:hypothetical protein
MLEDIFTNLYYFLPVYSLHLNPIEPFLSEQTIFTGIPPKNQKTRAQPYFETDNS